MMLTEKLVVSPMPLSCAWHVHALAEDITYIDSTLTITTLPRRSLEICFWIMSVPAAHFARLVRVFRLWSSMPNFDPVRHLSLSAGTVYSTCAGRIRDRWIWPAQFIMWTHFSGSSALETLNISGLSRSLSPSNCTLALWVGSIELIRSYPVTRPWSGG